MTVASNALLRQASPIFAVIQSKKECPEGPAHVHREKTAGVAPGLAAGAPGGSLARPTLGKNALARRDV